jgi:hypothetical protein
MCPGFRISALRSLRVDRLSCFALVAKRTPRPFTGIHKRWTLRNTGA